MRAPSTHRQTPSCRLTTTRTTPRCAPTLPGWPRTVSRAKRRRSRSCSPRRRAAACRAAWPAARSMEIKAHRRRAGKAAQRRRTATTRCRRRWRSAGYERRSGGSQGCRCTMLPAPLLRTTKGQRGIRASRRSQTSLRSRWTSPSHKTALVHHHLQPSLPRKRRPRRRRSRCPAPSHTSHLARRCSRTTLRRGITRSAFPPHLRASTRRSRRRYAPATGTIQARGRSAHTAPSSRTCTRKATTWPRASASAAISTYTQVSLCCTLGALPLIRSLTHSAPNRRPTAIPLAFHSDGTGDTVVAPLRHGARRERPSGDGGQEGAPHLDRVGRARRGRTAGRGRGERSDGRRHCASIRVCRASQSDVVRLWHVSTTARRDHGARAPTRSWPRLARTPVAWIVRVSTCSVACARTPCACSPRWGRPSLMRSRGCCLRLCTS